MRFWNALGFCFAIAVWSTQIAVAQNTVSEAKAVTYTTIFSFPWGEGPADGNGIIFGTSGEILGAKYYGGSDESGDIYQLRPPAKPSAEWVYTSLHSFKSPEWGPNTISRYKSVIYGTLNMGGKDNCGEIFALAKTASNPDKWQYKVAHKFSGSGSGGCGSQAAVVANKHGTLFGTAGPSGRNLGVVWQLDTRTDDAHFKVIRPFTKVDKEGAFPEYSTTEVYGGDLYGTTNSYGPSGGGTLFKVSPSNGSISIVETFEDPAIGLYPDKGLGKLKNGSWAGSTTTGGKLGAGTVFVLHPPKKSTAGWTHEIVHRFSEKYGVWATGAPLTDSDGSIYLATNYRGKYNCGSVLKFKRTKTGWETIVLYMFKMNLKDGCSPASKLVAHPNGGLYGTTTGGGHNNGGVVYKITGAGFAYPPL